MDMKTLIHPGNSNSSNESTHHNNGITNNCSINFPQLRATFPPLSVHLNPSSSLPILENAHTGHGSQSISTSRSSILSSSENYPPLRFIIPPPISSNTGTYGPSSQSNQTIEQDSTFNRNKEYETITHSTYSTNESNVQVQHKLKKSNISRSNRSTSNSTPSSPLDSQSSKISYRSTKSKARPGLRKGKWTNEESKYATQLTTYFKEGLLPIERGTMLRLYLSQKLNCEPMRITKKFTGLECIGKQVFRPCSPTPRTQIRLRQAEEELAELEKAFLLKLQENNEEGPQPSEVLLAESHGLEKSTNNQNTGSKSRRSSKTKSKTDRKKQLKHQTPKATCRQQLQEGWELEDEDNYSTSESSVESLDSNSRRSVDNIDDAGAVGLLLDFYYRANGEKSSDEIKVKKKNFKERPREENVISLDENQYPSTPLAEDWSDKEMMGSPTKRIRALSISDNGTILKRSRLNSRS